MDQLIPVAVNDGPNFYQIDFAIRTQPPAITPVLGETDGRGLIVMDGLALRFETPEAVHAVIEELITLRDGMLRARAEWLAAPRLGEVEF